MTAPMVNGGTSSAATPTFAGGFKVNQNVEQSQCIKVAVRLRPLVGESRMQSDEHRRNSKNLEKRAWTIDKNGTMGTLTQLGHVGRKLEGRTVFHFDQVFDEDTKTPLLYKSIARPMVRSVLNGKHATIFAYGQTGSGKTYTMQGDGKADSGQAGIIQLVASDLFRFMQQGEAVRRDFVVKVSYFEIYNEKIRDLLSDDSASGNHSNGGSNNNNNGVPTNAEEEVKIRTNSNGDIVMDLIQPEVINVDEVLELLIEGNTKRVVAATDMNTHSSRSHAIFRLTVESHDSIGPIDGPVHGVLRVSDFNLVDLAGSESVKSAKTNGVLRQLEGAKINKSLLALTNVIHALSLPLKKRPKHINYRDSKLTRILQPHLSGNAEMAILCCASPSKASLEETKSTLRFASRAKLVEMKPKVNEVLDDAATIKKLQEELAETGKLIEEMRWQLQNTTGCQSSSTGDSSDDSPTANPQDNYLKHNSKIKDSSCLPTAPDSRREKRQISSSYDSNRTNNLELQHSKSSLEMNHIFRRDSETSSDLSQKEEEFHASTGGFQLDAADPRFAKKTVQRYMRGNMKSMDHDDFFTFSGSIHDENDLQRLQSEISRATGQEIVILTPKREYHSRDPFSTPEKRTVQTEDESFDGPDASFTGVSKINGSYISTPDTIRGASTDRDISEESCSNEARNWRLRRVPSWDTINLNTTTREQVGQPLLALQNLTSKKLSIPDEVLIISDSTENNPQQCLTSQLWDANKKIKFLLETLEGSNDLVEGTFRDLERARCCIHDLVQRNLETNEKLRKVRHEETKVLCETGEVVSEHYWMLKGSIYMSLFFFISGGHELFLACVFFVWIILETNLSA